MSKNTKSDALKYDKKTPREHVLIRPDTYVGDTEPTIEPLYVVNEDKIIKENINFTPGFLKIVDELLVNARDASVNDKSCDTIKVEYNIEQVFGNVLIKKIEAFFNSKPRKFTKKNRTNIIK